MICGIYKDKPIYFVNNSMHYGDQILVDLHKWSAVESTKSELLELYAKVRDAMEDTSIQGLIHGKNDDLLIFLYENEYGLVDSSFEPFQQLGAIKRYRWVHHTGTPFPDEFPGESSNTNETISSEEEDVAQPQEETDLEVEEEQPKEIDEQIEEIKELMPVSDIGDAEENTSGDTAEPENEVKAEEVLESEHTVEENMAGAAARRIAVLREQYEKKISDMIDKHKEEIKTLGETHKEELAKVRANMAELMIDYQATISTNLDEKDLATEQKIVEMEDLIKDSESKWKSELNKIKRDVQSYKDRCETNLTKIKSEALKKAEGYETKITEMIGEFKTLHDGLEGLVRENVELHKLQEQSRTAILQRDRMNGELQQLLTEVNTRAVITVEERDELEDKYLLDIQQREHNHTEEIRKIRGEYATQLESIRTSGAEAIKVKEAELTKRLKRERKQLEDVISGKTRDLENMQKKYDDILREKDKTIVELNNRIDEITGLYNENEAILALEREVSVLKGQRDSSSELLLKIVKLIKADDISSAVLLAQSVGGGKV